MWINVYKHSFQKMAIIFIMAPSFALGQNYMKNWAMATSTMLTFQNSAITTSYSAGYIPLNSISASDRNGNLMFYLHGNSVYNSNHVPMPDADSMRTKIHRSGIYFPFLNDTNRYFLIHQGNDDPTNTVNGVKLNYSIVDMSLDGSSGNIELPYKNVPIVENSSESIHATAHRNGQQAWLAFKKKDSTSISFVLISDTIDTIINREALKPGDQNITTEEYQLKFSPDGKWLMYSCEYNTVNELIIYHFNNETAEIKYFKSISNPISNANYNPLCFSSNSSLLYFGQNNIGLNNRLLYQFDFANEIEPLLIDTLDQLVDMKLDPERRILFIPVDVFNVGAILAPNTIGTGCNVIDSIVSFYPFNVDSDFPNYISNWFNTSFCVEQNCVSDSAQFYFAGYRMDSAVWDFGEPSSGVLNHGLGQEVKHLYADTGTYTVTLYATTGMQTDTIVQTVHIDGPLNPLVFSNDSFNLCFGDSLVLNAFQPEASSYLWQDSSNLDQFIVKDSGWYSVSIENGCGVVIDSIYVSIDDSIQLQPLLDTFFCEGDTLTLAAHTNENATWLWSNGNSTSKTQITANGNNEIETWVTATNACGSVSDTVIITILPQPNIAWFSDSILCNQALPVVTNPNTFGVEYTLLYNFNSSVFDTVFDWTIDTAGLYYLVAENRCDTLVRRAFLNPQQIIEKELLQSIALCPGEEVVLDAFWEGSSYAWSENVDATLLNDSAITVTSAPLSDQSGSLSDQTGTETYTVTITNPPCVRTLSTTVIFLSEDSCGNTCAFSVPNVFTPNQDGVNDAFRITNSCESQSFRFSIYNRWGTLVHSGAESIAYWDGTSNGAFVNSGVYFVIIEYTESAGQEKTVKATVSVLR